MARHRSAPLSDIVHTMLKHSDNDIAETLLRMTALGAGRPATFEGGSEVVLQVLSRVYGVWLDNFELHDGSGLSRADRIPAATLAQRYAHALGSVLDGLPVSGEAGSTLGPEYGRFDDADSTCAVGGVHAKTGTLTGAIALSGLTQGKDGKWKVFSFVENGATADPNAIKGGSPPEGPGAAFRINHSPGTSRCLRCREPPAGRAAKPAVRSCLRSARRSKPTGTRISHAAASPPRSGTAGPGRLAWLRPGPLQEAQHRNIVARAEVSDDPTYRAPVRSPGVPLVRRGHRTPGGYNSFQESFGGHQRR